MKPFDTSGLVNRKHALRTVRELDAFPKVADSYKESTASGGGISIVVFIVIILLIVSEVQYYTTTELKFGCEVDADFTSKLRMNVDITVAMKCDWVGADVLDMTGQALATDVTPESLKLEDVNFELTVEQRRYFEMTQHLNAYLREEYHSIQTFLWKSGLGSMPHRMPARGDKQMGPTDACRIHGTMVVNKVAGNFHITAGKSVPVFPRGHAHLAGNIAESDYNFSHRIDHFSFGKATPGIINPMDGDEKTTTANRHMFQYFIQVVATKVVTDETQMDTYQYAVTEHNRTIDHAAGSHGIPGIFVKYDLSSLKISVREEHKSYWQFLVRLCGIVGGIFATSGMIHGLCGFLFKLVCCRLGWNKSREVVGETVPVRNLSTGELPLGEATVRIVPTDAVPPAGDS